MGIQSHIKAWIRLQELARNSAPQHLFLPFPYPTTTGARSSCSPPGTKAVHFCPRLSLKDSKSCALCALGFLGCQRRLCTSTKPAVRTELLARHKASLILLSSIRAFLIPILRRWESRLHSPPRSKAQTVYDRPPSLASISSPC